ncbi:MAG: hypothetical protein J6U93_07505 [Alistipes sp.]|nr:hypothetical protein [Alistipes sp.]
MTVESFYRSTNLVDRIEATVDTADGPMKGDKIDYHCHSNEYYAHDDPRQCCTVEQLAKPQRKCHSQGICPDNYGTHKQY